MSVDAVQHWLKSKLATQIAVTLVGAMVAFVVGLIALFLTFWLAYAVLFIGERAVSAVGELVWSKRLRLAHAWRMAVCAVFMLALFVEWLRRSPWDLGKYRAVNAPPFRRTAVSHGGGWGDIAMLLANPQASSTLVTEMLYTGPRLVIGVARLIRAARRLGCIDRPACAWALAFLASHDGAVTHPELVAAWPEADWERLRFDLARIPGVVSLEKGLSLTHDLRAELRGLEPANLRSE
jgi:hypothetical protein